MATGNITLAAVVQGGADGTWSLNTMGNTFTAPTAVSAETIVTLTVGTATVTVPSGCTAAIIIPPNAVFPVPNPSWGGTLTLKGVSGDTGVPITNKFPIALEWDATNVPASFAITSTASGATLAVRFM